MLITACPPFIFCSPFISKKGHFNFAEMGHYNFAATPAFPILTKKMTNALY